MSSGKVPIELTEDQVRLVLNVLRDTADDWQKNAHRGPRGGLTNRGRCTVKVAEQMREAYRAIDEARFDAHYAAEFGQS